MFINCYEFLINDKHVLEIDYEKKIDYNSIEILDNELKDIIKQNNIVKDGIILILDMSKVSSGDVNLRVAKKVIKNFQDNFPDFLHKCIVLNYNIKMKMIISIIKSFLDPDTSRKIVINKDVNNQINFLINQQKNINMLSNN
tara:strand:+ start:2572 stop:2997 length:426 start_codon:yes stop_codon:yes gene_type:complete